jgi:hypothetical protein
VCVLQTALASVDQTCLALGLPRPAHRAGAVLPPTCRGARVMLALMLPAWTGVSMPPPGWGRPAASSPPWRWLGHARRHGSGSPAAVRHSSPVRPGHCRPGAGVGKPHGRPDQGNDHHAGSPRAGLSCGHRYPTITPSVGPALPAHRRDQGRQAHLAHPVAGAWMRWAGFRTTGFRCGSLPMPPACGVGAVHDRRDRG